MGCDQLLPFGDYKSSTSERNSISPKALPESWNIMVSFLKTLWSSLNQWRNHFFTQFWVFSGCFYKIFTLRQFFETRVTSVQFDYSFTICPTSSTKTSRMGWLVYKPYGLISVWCVVGVVAVWMTEKLVYSTKSAVVAAAPIEIDVI